MLNNRQRAAFYTNYCLIEGGEHLSSRTGMQARKRKLSSDLPNLPLHSVASPGTIPDIRINLLLLLSCIVSFPLLLAAHSATLYSMLNLSICLSLLIFLCTPFHIQIP